MKTYEISEEDAPTEYDLTVDRAILVAQRNEAERTAKKLYAKILALTAERDVQAKYFLARVAALRAALQTYVDTHLAARGLRPWPAVSVVGAYEAAVRALEESK